MGIEIEEKFVVNDLRWRYEEIKAVENIFQGYLAKGVRLRITNGTTAKITIKGPKKGIVCQEFEYSIPLFDTCEMMTLCESHIVKFRYTVQANDKIWYVDQFQGKHEGLCVAEIELESANETYRKPIWCGEVYPFSNYEISRNDHLKREALSVPQ